jgi:hypothetical protein
MLSIGVVMDSKQLEAFAKLVAAKAIAELKSQEPIAWVAEDVCEGQYIDGRPRKIWWECEKGVGTAFYAHPPQRTEERNFCPRCGKRTADLTVIHTCTPPQNIEQDLSEQGRKKSAILGNNIEEMVNNGLPFLTALDTALKVYDHHTPKLHPPQRTWVDLTRTQMQDVYFEVLKEHRGGHQMQGQLAFGEALQAKIREKNT